MRSTILLLVAAAALAGCSMMPAFVGGGDDKPAAVTSAAPPPATTAAAVAPEAQSYEISYTNRGKVRRVLVMLNGRKVDTLNMSKRRTEPTAHCCTEDGCEEIEATKACTTFKMYCDVQGACKKYEVAAKATGKS